MMPAKRAAWLLVVLASTAVAACGGGGEAPGETLGEVTAVGTKEATPTTAGADGDGGPPAPADPELDEALTLVTSGELEATIEPGGAYSIDPLQLAAEAGAEPNCDNLQFDFSWQVIDPWPADGVGLAWQLDRSGNLVTVASGAAGNQAVPCGTLAAANQGATAITVAVKYLIGALE